MKNPELNHNSIYEINEFHKYKSKIKTTLTDFIESNTNDITLPKPIPVYCRNWFVFGVLNPIYLIIITAILGYFYFDIESSSFNQDPFDFTYYTNDFEIPFLVFGALTGIYIFGWVWFLLWTIYKKRKYRQAWENIINFNLAIQLGVNVIDWIHLSEFKNDILKSLTSNEVFKHSSQQYNAKYITNVDDNLAYSGKIIDYDFIKYGYYYTLKIPRQDQNGRTYYQTVYINQEVFEIDVNMFENEDKILIVNHKFFDFMKLNNPSKDMKKVSFENEKFNKKFTVYATDEIKASMLLTILTQEKLLANDLASFNKTPNVVLKIQNKKLYIIFEGYFSSMKNTSKINYVDPIKNFAVYSDSLIHCVNQIYAIASYLNCIALFQSQTFYI